MADGASDLNEQWKLSLSLPTTVGQYLRSRCVDEVRTGHDGLKHRKPSSLVFFCNYYWCIECFI